MISKEEYNKAREIVYQYETEQLITSVDKDEDALVSMCDICTKEAAEILECSTRNVAYLVKGGKLKPINKHSRFYIFRRKDVESLKIEMNK